MCWVFIWITFTSRLNNNVHLSNMISKSCNTVTSSHIKAVFYCTKVCNCFHLIFTCMFQLIHRYCKITLAVQGLKHCASNENDKLLLSRVGIVLGKQNNWKCENEALATVFSIHVTEEEARRGRSGWGSQGTRESQGPRHYIHGTDLSWHFPDSFWGLKERSFSCWLCQSPRGW